MPMSDKKQLDLLRSGVEAWNAWRRENADALIVCLSEADSSWPSLSHPDLRGADLSGADLRGADLSQAHLKAADLRGADLSAADLSGADLGAADLGGASLRGANLMWATLSNTTLDGADFKDARMGGTVLKSLNLSAALNIQSVRFYRPCAMTTDTLYASQGAVPESFLRGAGLPEEMIRHLPYLIGHASPIDFYSCFISYSHADESFARRLHDGLQGRGIRCWRDEHEILPGDDMKDAIDRGIRLWDKVLLCCSEASLKSWWVDKEIDKALAKEEGLWKQRQKKVVAIIPLNLDGFLFNGWESGQASMIKTRLAADFTGWEKDNAKFEEQFERLVKALRADDGARPPPPKSKL
jgi:uncharacterized protein YjbI with pentapeptide repeats